MLAAGTAALVAGCSDASRFSGDPFADPFRGASASNRVDKAPTGAISRPKPLTAAPVQSRPLAPPAAPVASTAPAPATMPAPAHAAKAGTYEHWSAEGGTPIVVSQGDTAAILANRYGVPADALLKVNGLASAAQVQPGARLVIPVYRAAAAPVSAPVAAAPAVARAEEKPAPRLAAPEKTLKKPEPKRSLSRADDESEKAAPAPAAKASHKAELDQSEPKKPARAAESQKPAKAKLARAEEPSEAPVRAEAAAKSRAPAPKAEVHGDGAKAKAKLAKAESAKAESTKPEPKAEAAKVQAEPKKTVVAKVEKPAKQVREPSPAVNEESKPAPEKPVAKSKAEPKAEAKVAEAEAPASASSTKNVDRGATASIPVSQEQKSGESASAKEFRWPARGRVIQGFSAGGNDGINISVPEGTQVKAAEGGVVAYAGNELKGYGNLVLIRHPNGFVTAYAHNGEIEVKRGDQVKRGQTIAKSGQSGNVSSPQLHFELRKGSTPVDPTNYLAEL